MVITTYNPTQTFAQGQLTYPADTFNYSSGVWLDVTQSVFDDAFGLSPSGLTSYCWSVKWSLFLWSYEALISPSLFISAIPKYNLGIVSYIYDGFCSGEEYWNFTAQRFRTNVCNSLSLHSSYPGEGPFATIIGEKNPVLVYDTDEPYSLPYATGVYVRLQSAPTAGMIASVLYTVGVADLPSDYAIYDF
jgi:hypothetical protein